jgi:putative ABC transport system permease protein
MSLLTRLRAFAGHVRRRSAIYGDVDQEFQSHIAHRADDLVRRGLSRNAAERAARIEFGSIEGYKDAARDARGLAFYDEARSNIVFAWRGIRHRPLQAIIIVVTLTLGIGISAGVFATLDVIAFRARVDANPATFARVFSAYGTDSTPPGFPAASRLSDYLAYRDRLRSLRVIAGWQAIATTVDGRSGTTTGTLVTCEFFDVYAPVRPLVGRVLQANDCAARDNVVVISETLWRDVLSSAPDVVGRVLRINGQPLRVVGVAPVFSGPVNDANFWTPYTTRGYLRLGDDDPSSPTALSVTLDARLRDGYSRADARAELAVLAAQQDGIHHGRHTVTFVTDGSMLNRPGNTAAVLTIVAFVFVALACLALVACANVVSLLLAVAHTRHTEMALRMALGSGSARLARMLLTETLALAAIAGVLASIVASRTPPYLIGWLTQRPLTYPTHPSWHLFAFLFSTTLIASLVVSSAPIRASLRLDLVAALRGLRKDSHDGRGRSSNALMGVQIGGAVALLVAAVSLGRMSARIAASPPHVESRRVLALNIVPTDRVGGAWGGYHEDVARVAAAVPGVEMVAFGSAAPLDDERTGTIVVTATGTGKQTLPAIQVSSSYFDTFGIRLVRGRLLKTADDSCVASVCPAVVSLEAARELWPSDDPLGKLLRVVPAGELEIVGVVSDAPSDISARVEALMVYRPWTPAERRYQTFARINGDAATATHAIAAAIADNFPGAVAAPETLQAALDRFTDAFYRIGLVVGGVALVAATLALVGVYGVVSLSAKRRMKEMGIRIALGARDIDVYKALLRSNAPPVFIGLGVGAAIAVGFATVVDRVAATTLPIPFADPFAFWGAPLALAVVVVVAIAAPARRATGAAPVQSLRQD